MTDNEPLAIDVARRRRHMQAAVARVVAEAPKRPRPEPSVAVAAAPAGVPVLANDFAPYADAMAPYAATVGGFLGYPYLAMLSQVAEYRKICSTLAEEMTRAGIRLTTVPVNEGDTIAEDRPARIAKLGDALHRFDVMSVLRQALELEGYFGRIQLYIDVTVRGDKLASEDSGELQTPLLPTPAKVAKGSLKGFRIIEPAWSYPDVYNSTNPLKEDFYAPQIWHVQNLRVHASRLITLISHPVPDMLRAAYAFGGVSMAQMAEPYVNNWLRTRDSVGDLVHSFSLSGLSTDLSAFLAGPVGAPSPMGEMDATLRAEYFNALRDNKGLMLLDKESEEFFQFNTPLSGVDALQAQAQEQMAAVSSIPLVKLLGITPSGLNASTDGEIKVFYDFIMSRCERVLRAPLTLILQLLQLNEFGAIDPGITFVFEPLHQQTEAERAQVEKMEAETDTTLINAGVITPEESRTALAGDDESRFHGLDLTRQIDTPEPEVPDVDDVDDVDDDPDDAP